MNQIGLVLSGGGARGFAHLGVLKVLDELKPMSPEERINQRIVKFGKMGFWEEVPNSTQPSSTDEEAHNNGLGNVPSETASM